MIFDILGMLQRGSMTGLPLVDYTATQAEVYPLFIVFMLDKSVSGKS
jgi:hypothetical protein